MTEFLIYKYSIERPENAYGQYHLDLPLAGSILSCQIQNQRICFWVEFPAPDEGEDFEMESCVFHVFGTGRRFLRTPEMDFIATVQQPPFVWHVYEEHK